MSKRRRQTPRTTAPRIKAGCIEAVKQEWKIRQGLRLLGLTLDVHLIDCGQAVSYHWQFRAADTERLVLDYWPGSGTTLDAAKNKGRVSGPWEAARLAGQVAGSLRSPSGQK